MLESEPTRILGNASSAIAAAGVALGTTLPQPWGVIACAAGALISVFLTEWNRSRVSSETTVADVRRSVDKLGATIEEAKKL